MPIAFPNRMKPSFEDLYRDHYAKTLSYIKRKVTDPEDAEDLASEVFLYCFRNYDSYDPSKSAVTTWLYLVVNSRLKNYYRDHVPTADIEPFAQVVEDDRIDLDRGLYLEQLRDTVMRALDALPERQRKIVMYRCFQELSYEEIADRMEMTVGNVRVVYSRALDKLAAMKDISWKEFMQNG